MMIMKRNEKKYIAPNGASLGRWIAVLMVGLLIAIAISFALEPFKQNLTGTFLGVGYAQILQLMDFVFFFAGVVIALKLVGKTSLKDFVLGAGNSLNKKECLTMLGLSVAGFSFVLLTDLSYIHLRGVSAGNFAGLVLVMLVLAWMQTTLEELLFRGFLLRWACKNNIGFNKKSILVAVISSVLFALAHLGNPEVTSLSGMERIVMVSVYAIPGMAFFLMDLYFGNLMPGIIMHWVNNFLLFTLISGEVAAVNTPTLLVDTSSHSAYGVLISTLLSNLPFVAYIIWDIRKKKKAAVAL